jgi:hypothetical protein
VAANHFLPKLEQDCLDSVISAPVLQHRAPRRVNNAIGLAYAMKVNFCDEAYGRRLLRVRLAAVKREGVDAILEDSLWREQDRSEL